MQISRIVVNNFCSIKYAELSPTKFNIFVGQNNHGKTNFFEAVSWFYSGKGEIDEIRFGRKGEAEVIVELTFVGVQDGLARMKNEKNRKSIENVIGAVDSLRVRRISSDNKSRKIFIEEQETWLDKNPAGFDTAFNDFLPVFEYVDTSTHLADVNKYGKGTAIGSMLSGVLSVILEQSKKYKDFRKTFDELFGSAESEVRIELDKLSSHVRIYLAKQFPDCTKVEFNISQPAFDELLKGFSTSLDDGILTSATEKGDGMQRALMLAILETYADYRKLKDAIGRTFLFFIDEGELHLHPTAQRKLKRALSDLAENGDQVFINTHSSVLVTDELASQRIFRVEKINKETIISELETDGKPALVYELLGGSPSDLLLPRNFLIVEGRSDFEFLSRVVSRFYKDKPRIQIVYAEGSSEQQRRSMNAINKLFNPLAVNPVYRDRLVIVCDKPSTTASLADFEKFKNTYPSLTTNCQLYVLTSSSLEEYYPEPFKATAEQAATMSQTPGLKVELSRHVGSQIEQSQFENEMTLLKAALDKCWKEAY